MMKRIRTRPGVVFASSRRSGSAVQSVIKLTLTVVRGDGTWGGEHRPHYPRRIDGYVRFITSRTFFFSTGSSTLR
jgi:hypothetical protein